MNKFKDSVRRLGRIWYIFVIWVIAVVVVFGLVFGLRTAYKDEEQISVFIAARDVDFEKMQAKLDRAKPDYLYNIKLGCCTSIENETIYNVSWMEAATLNTDIYVLPLSKLSDDICNAYFMPLTRDFITADFGDIDTYSSDGKLYGVKLYDSATKLGGSADIIKFADGNFDEDYYIFFGKHCAHLGGLTGSRYDGAVKLAAALLDRTGA